MRSILVKKCHRNLYNTTSKQKKELKKNDETKNKYNYSKDNKKYERTDNRKKLMIQFDVFLHK